MKHCSSPHSRLATSDPAAVKHASHHMAAELAKLELHKLSKLFLDKSDLSAAVMTELTKADWPRLSCLFLSQIDVDAAAGVLGLDQKQVQELKLDADRTVEEKYVERSV